MIWILPHFFDIQFRTFFIFIFFIILKCLIVRDFLWRLLFSIYYDRVKIHYSSLLLNETKITFIVIILSFVVYNMIHNNILYIISGSETIRFGQCYEGRRVCRVCRVSVIWFRRNVSVKKMEEGSGKKYAPPSLSSIVWLKDKKYI